MRWIAVELVVFAFLLGAILALASRRHDNSGLVCLDQQKNPHPVGSVITLDGQHIACVAVNSAGWKETK